MIYSKKQIFARHRNWAKARILGMTFTLQYFTDEEKLLIARIQTLKGELIRNWDLNSKKLGLNPKEK